MKKNVSTVHIILMPFLFIGLFILIYSTVVSAEHTTLEKKTGTCRIVYLKKYDCTPYQPSVQSAKSQSLFPMFHPPSAVAYIPNQGIVVASSDSLLESALSIISLNGTVLRSAKNPWGFPTHLYYNERRKRIYFWQAPYPSYPFQPLAYALDTNLRVIDSFNVKSFPDWFIKVGMIQSNRKVEVDRILKKIRTIAEKNLDYYTVEDIWRLVSFIGKRYIFFNREPGYKDICGYDLLKKSGFNFDLRIECSKEDSLTLNSETCIPERRTKVFSDINLYRGLSGVEISDKELVIAWFHPFILTDCFQYILLDGE
ncbi:MAG: hypothetical protein U0264_04485 [Candidatus Kapaibacterium sp.]